MSLIKSLNLRRSPASESDAALGEMLVAFSVTATQLLDANALTRCCMLDRMSQRANAKTGKNFSFANSDLERRVGIKNGAEQQTQKAKDSCPPRVSFGEYLSWLKRENGGNGGGGGGLYLDQSGEKNNASVSTFDLLDDSSDGGYTY